MHASWPLDDVVWRALTTHHAGFAQGSAHALRYAADVAPFAATHDTSPAGLQSLASIVSSGDQIGILTSEDILAPAGFVVMQSEPVDRMVGASPPSKPIAIPVVTLGAVDVGEMMRLVEMTRPGPFALRTRELGNYIGVREQGRLVAMAGERMRFDGFTEISAVCVHPSCRGRGYAADLVIALWRTIAAQGQRPFLHVLSGNEAAITLYRKLGFELQRKLRFTLLRAI